MKPLNREILEDSILTFIIGMVLFAYLPLVGLSLMIASGSFIFIVLFDSVKLVGGG